MSLDIEFTTEKVYELFIESGGRYIDYEEVGLYLALTRSENELVEIGISKNCPKRKNKIGRPPVLTGCATNSYDREKRYKPWVQRKSEPKGATKKKIITEALKVVILFVMMNHMYCFEEYMKKQRR